MIYSLSGTLLETEDGIAVVECMGVGYKCLVSDYTAQNLPKLGEKVFLYTFMQLRQDACDLLGFIEKEELTCFKLLTTVNGVGAKMALAILSTLSPDRVAMAVLTEDTDSLQNCSGVGKKLASRIVLELKDKMSSSAFKAQEKGESYIAPVKKNSSMEEAKEALMALGFTSNLAVSALSKCSEGMTVEEMIKTALKATAK